jgi:hypothetical protein
MIDVTDGAYVHVRLISLELFFCHFSSSSS